MSQSHATLAGTVDEMISAAVRGHIAQRRISTTQVAVAAGISRAALYRKLGNDSPWQAEEVDRLARFFAVTRDSLYEGRADYRSVGPATLGAVGARSSTDRASDYGSERGHIFELPHLPRHRRVNRRRSASVIPLYLVADNPLADDRRASA